MTFNNSIAAPLAVVCAKGSGVTGLGIVRSLGRRGIPVAVVATGGQDNLAAASRYCSKAFFIDVTDENYLIKTLVDIGKRQKTSPVLFFDNDFMIWLVGEKAKELDDIYLFTTSKYQSIKLLDKKWQLEQATSACISVPESWFPECWEDVQKIKLQGKRLIAKPRSVAYAANFPFKILGANNPHDLCVKLKKHVVSPRGLVIQEMIEGPDSDIWFALGYSNFGNGEIQIVSGVKKIQTGTGFGGVMAAGYLHHCEKICNLVECFIKHIDYKGIFGVEIKYDKSKDDYIFIEINPRTERIQPICLLAGLDSSAMAYEELTGNNFNSQMPQKRQYRGCWIDGRGIRKHIWKSNIFLQSIGLFARYYNRIKWAVYDTEDMAPLNQRIKIYVKRMPNRLWKLLHRSVK